jgi:hypothetical protein
VTTQERLLRRLREAGADLPPCAELELRRTYRTRRTGIGRWSWYAYCPHAREPGHDHSPDLRFGSHWSMTELLASEQLVFQVLESCGDTCVDPVEATRPAAT